MARGTMDVVYFLIFLLCTFASARLEADRDDHDVFSKKELQQGVIRFSCYYHTPLHKNVYPPENVMVSNVKIHNDTIYLALPKLKEGVPLMIGWVPLEFQEEEKEEPKEFSQKEFSVVYQWSTINFTWTSHRHYSTALKNAYNPKNILVANMRIYKDTIYLALPRLKPGVPVTIGWLPLETQPDEIYNHLVAPFPTWEMNQVSNCESFQSVHAFEIDSKGIMWVVDNGRRNPHKSRLGQVCLPSLILIDLEEDSRIISRYIFPSDIVRADSYLKDIVVDDFDGGYAYIVDNSKSHPGIIVYSRAEDASWKFEDPRSMRGEINNKKTENFVSSMNRMDLSENINAIALSPEFRNINDTLERYVFYSSLLSLRVYAVYASWLRNKSFVESFPMKTNNAIPIGDRKNPSDGMIMDENGFLYYGIIDKVYRWNTTEDFSNEQESVSVKDKGMMHRFAFDENGGFYVLLTKFYKFVMNELTATELRFVIKKTNLGVKSYIHTHLNDTQNDTMVEAGNGNAVRHIFTIPLYINILLALFNSMQ